jgi:hypothetical protein
LRVAGAASSIFLLRPDCTEEGLEDERAEAVLPLREAAFLEAFFGVAFLGVACLLAAFFGLAALPSIGPELCDEGSESLSSKQENIITF